MRADQLDLVPLQRWLILIREMILDLVHRQDAHIRVAPGILIAGLKTIITSRSSMRSCHCSASDCPGRRGIGMRGDFFFLGNMIQHCCQFHASDLSATRFPSALAAHRISKNQEPRTDNPLAREAPQ